MFGGDPVLPFDLTEATFIIEGYKAGLSSAELIALHLCQLEKRPEDIVQAADVIKQSRMKSKKQFEKRFSHRISQTELEPEQLVLVRNSQRDAGIANKYAF